jgi:FkbM family methyltransferase
MWELSANAGSSGTVVIIEPAPENIERLHSILDNLPYDNVELVQCAAWDEHTNMELRLASRPDDHKVDVDNIEHDATHRPQNTYDEAVEVTARPLDTILRDLGVTEVDYMTVAVNGAELKVLEGAVQTLERSSNLRLFVKGHARTETGAPINRPIREFLEQKGFRTRLTKAGEPAAGNSPDWTRRAGNVFAYRVHAS